MKWGQPLQCLILFVISLQSQYCSTTNAGNNNKRAPRDNSVSPSLRQSTKKLHASEELMQRLRIPLANNRGGNPTQLYMTPKMKFKQDEKSKLLSAEMNDLKINEFPKNVPARNSLKTAENQKSYIQNDFTNGQNNGSIKPVIETRSSGNTINSSRNVQENSSVKPVIETRTSGKTINSSRNVQENSSVKPVIETRTSGKTINSNDLRNIRENSSVKPVIESRTSGKTINSHDSRIIRENGLVKQVIETRSLGNNYLLNGMVNGSIKPVIKTKSFGNGVETKSSLNPNNENYSSNPGANKPQRERWVKTTEYGPQGSFLFKLKFERANGGRSIMNINNYILNSREEYSRHEDTYATRIIDLYLQEESNIMTRDEILNVKRKGEDFNDYTNMMQMTCEVHLVKYLGNGFAGLYESQQQKTETDSCLITYRGSSAEFFLVPKRSPYQFFLTARSNDKRKLTLEYFEVALDGKLTIGRHPNGKYL